MKFRLFRLQALDAVAKRFQYFDVILCMQKVVISMEVCKCMDVLAQSSPEKWPDYVSKLASFVWTKDSSAIAVNILTGKQCQSALAELVKKWHIPSANSILEMFLNGLVYQYGKRNSIAVGLGRLAEIFNNETVRLKCPVMEHVRLVSAMLREYHPRLSLLQCLIVELSRAASGILRGEF